MEEPRPDGPWQEEIPDVRLVVRRSERIRAAAQSAGLAVPPAPARVNVRSGRRMPTRRPAQSRKRPRAEPLLPASAFALDPRRVLESMLHSTVGPVCMCRADIERLQLGPSWAARQFDELVEFGERSYHAYVCPRPRLCSSEDISHANFVLDVVQDFSLEELPMPAGTEPGRGPEPLRNLAPDQASELCLCCASCARAGEAEHAAAHKSRLCKSCHAQSLCGVLVLYDSETQGFAAVARSLCSDHAPMFTNLCLLRFSLNGELAGARRR